MSLKAQVLIDLTTRK